MKRSFIIYLLVVFLFVVTGCVSPQLTKTKDAVEEDVAVYTRFNIHGQQKSGSIVNASFANWTGPFQGHVVIPMNTKVIVKSKMRGIGFVVVDSGQKINFQYDERRMEMSSDDYIALITSPRKVSTASFSQKDLKGIAEGKALKGMSKNGVMAALGYPATHKTPSPKSNQWIYWNSRYGTREVVFNNAGIVINVRD